MGIGGFNNDEMSYLTSLPAVLRVTKQRIYYEEGFKRECVRRYLNGEMPTTIFRESGLDPQLIGPKRIERCFARWASSERLRGVPDYGERRLRVTDARNELQRQPKFRLPVGRPGTAAANNEQSQSPYAVDAKMLNVGVTPIRDIRDLLIIQQVERIEELEQEITRLRKLVDEQEADSEVVVDKPSEASSDLEDPAKATPDK